MTAVVLALTATACGSAALGGHPPRTPGSRSVRLAPADVPVPVGRGRLFRVPAVSAAVARRAPIAGIPCRAARDHPYGVHLELYAHRLVLPVPSGIGVAPPQRRSGVYIAGGACVYALRTYEPTGVIVIDRGRRLTLGTLFAVWGQPLSSHALAGFRGRVAAFVDGHRWPWTSRSIPLRRHAEIVLEIAGELPAHREYRFPPNR